MYVCCLQYANNTSVTEACRGFCTPNCIGVIYASHVQAIVQPVYTHCSNPLNCQVTMSVTVWACGSYGWEGENEIPFEPSPENWRRPGGWLQSILLKNISDNITSFDTTLHEARNAIPESFWRLLTLHADMWLDSQAYDCCLDSNLAHDVFSLHVPVFACVSVARCCLSVRLSVCLSTQSHTPAAG